MKAYATVYLNDISINFSCYLEWNDYGVPGSPRWLEPTDIEIESVEIFGKEIYDIKKIPEEWLDMFYEYSDKIEEWSYAE